MQVQRQFPWIAKRREVDPMLSDKQYLLKEIQSAHQDWQHAQQRLDYVLDTDQIDYAIYALEAAEKRYEMLLKSAKRLNMHVLQPGMHSRATGG